MTTQVNVPNALTLLRLALSLPLVALLAMGDNAVAATAVFALAMATDAIDGRLARSRGSETTFGKLMDPVADKALVGGALVALAADGRVVAWVVAVILLREVAVSALRWQAKREGTVIAASAFGKAKTAIQSLAVPMLILVPDPYAVLPELVLALTLLVTLISGAAYALAYATRAPIPAHPAPA